MLYSKNKDTIYHATLGQDDGLSGFFNAVKNMADKTHQPIKFCWNGTLATANPGDTKEGIAGKWDKERTDYQKTKKNNHKAICQECN